MVAKLDTAVILAGGLGTRLRSVVADRPKPMALVARRPFLEHLMQYWHKQGIQRFVLSVGYRNESIREHFGDSYAGCKLEYVVETEPLGTGGGLLMCQRTLNLTDPFLLLNGDTYFAVDLSNLAHQAQKHDADWVFSLFPTSETQRYLAVQLTDSGKLEFRVEGNSVLRSGMRWANGGVYWIHPRALLPFQDLPTPLSLEVDMFPLAEQLGQVFCGLPSEATFIDIGVPDDYQRAQTMPCFL